MGDNDNRPGVTPDPNSDLVEFVPDFVPSQGPDLDADIPTTLPGRTESIPETDGGSTVEAVPPVQTPTESTGEPEAVASAEPDDDGLAGFVLADDEAPQLVPAAPTVESLQAQLAELQQRLDSRSQPQAAQQGAAQAELQSEPSKVPVFASDDEFDEVMADRGKFEAWMERRDQAVEAKAIETVLPQVVAVTARVAQHIYSMSSTADKFYAANPHLAPHRDFVGKVFQGLSAKYPDLTPEQLVSATAREATRIVKAHSKPERRPANGAVVPFAPPTGVRPAVPQRQQMDDLAADLAAIRL